MNSRDRRPSRKGPPRNGPQRNGPPRDNPQRQGTPRSNASKTPTARLLALKAVQQFDEEGVFVSSALDSLFRQHQTELRERRLATELASHLVRRRLTIDTVLSRYVERDRASVDPEVWSLLQLGCCQLIFLPHIPPHAAVHETVSLCETFDIVKAKGFVNGTLRTIEREIIREALTAPRAEDAESDSSGAAWNSVVPLSELTELESWLKNCDRKSIPVLEQRGAGWEFHQVQLARTLFSSPVQSPALFVAETCSLPSWLVTRWLTQGHDLKRAFQFALWFTTPGRVSLRINLTKTTPDQVAAALKQAEIPHRPGPWPESIDLEKGVAVGELPGFHKGHLSIQDLSAMSAVDLLAPQPNEQILDLCAAPGGKSCHLAERLAGTGRVVATDLSEKRLISVTENIERLQLRNIEAVAISEDGHDIPAGPYDAVLVDVPCSNTGVLGKRPEARWRISPDSFERLVPVQKQLLSRAIELTKSGGRIVYSTCSIDREENQDIVQAILKKHPEVQLREERQHWPGQPADGGYQALLFRS